MTDSLRTLWRRLTDTQCRSVFLGTGPRCTLEALIASAEEAGRVREALDEVHAGTENGGVMLGLAGRVRLLAFHKTTETNQIRSEVSKYRAVVEAARTIAGNEHRYDHFPVPSAAIGWHDARRCLQSALDALDKTL